MVWLGTANNPVPKGEAVTLGAVDPAVDAAATAAAWIPTHLRHLHAAARTHRRQSPNVGVRRFRLTRDIVPPGNASAGSKG